MAHVRKHRGKRLVGGKSTFWWYMVEDDDTAHRCGPGKKGERRARAWAARVNDMKDDLAAGIAPRASCLWSLGELRDAYLADARLRGLATAQPKAEGKLSELESHWRQLTAFFGEETNLDDLSQTSIRQYITARQRFPVAVNRDLWGTLRPALRLARDTDEASYRGDPFRGLRKLDEKRRRRKPIALLEKEAEKFIRICWTVDRELGAFAEHLYLTASRHAQEPEDIRGGLARYAPQKRGIARAFELYPRLRAVLRAPRRFHRERWAEAAKKFGKPGLRPHDLRHTKLTIEGDEPDATLDSIRGWGGWTTVAVADSYLHPSRRAIRAPGTRRKRHLRREK